jgi:hypothetical protein
MLFVVSKPKDTSWAGPTPWPIVHRIVESLVHNVKTQGEAPMYPTTAPVSQAPYADPSKVMVALFKLGTFRLLTCVIPGAL